MTASPKRSVAKTPAGKEESPHAQESPAPSHAHRIDHFEYESDWHAHSVLTFARQTRDSLPDRTPTDLALRTLVDDFIVVADAYYCKGIQLLEGDGNSHTPLDRQSLISRISTEWAAVLSLVSSSRMLPEGNDAVLALSYLVQKACQDLHLHNQVAVLPQVGRKFSLVRFHYSPEIAIVGIPLTSIYCPWEWSIIWHEVASLYLRDAFGKQIAEYLHALMQRFPSDCWPNPLEDLAVLRPWADELLEDAVGVIFLGDTMAEMLDTFLAPYYNDDDSSNKPHPPRPFRVAVAKSLALVMQWRAAVDSSAAPAGEDSAGQRQSIVQHKKALGEFFDISDAIIRHARADLDAHNRLIGLLRRGESLKAKYTVESDDAGEAAADADTLAAVSTPDLDQWQQDVVQALGHETGGQMAEQIAASVSRIQAAIEDSEKGPLAEKIGNWRERARDICDVMSHDQPFYAMQIALALEALQTLAYELADSPSGGEENAGLFRRFSAQDLQDAGKVFNLVPSTEWEQDSLPPRPAVIIAAAINAYKTLYANRQQRALSNADQQQRALSNEESINIRDIVPRVTYSYLRAWNAQEPRNTYASLEARAAVNQARALLAPGYKTVLDQINSCATLHALQLLVFSEEDNVEDAKGHSHPRGISAVVTLSGVVHGETHIFDILHKHQTEGAIKI